MEDGGLEPHVANGLLADSAGDRGRKAFVECELEEALAVVQLLQKSRQGACGVDGSVLLL
jgi:hypothetical protein